MKSFASAALMAVFASAQEGTDYWGTGATRFNALVTNLFDSDDDSTKLDLHTYYVGKNQGDEFHLDLVLYFPDADFEPNIEYGFCFAVSTDDSIWDCMRARTTIDVDALATEVDDDSYDTIDDFDLNDMVENSGTAGIQTFDAVALQSDDLIMTDSAQDWS